MVKGYYNKVNTYKFQNYINVDNKFKKDMKTFEVKCSSPNLFKKNKAIVLSY